MQLKNAYKHWLFNLLQFMLFGLIAGWIFVQNQPIPLAKATLDASQKLQCVSYAPYYGKDQSPLVPNMHIDPQQIEHDLEKLSAISNCVRTYSVNQGMHHVPAAAKKVGLTVYLGAWIGWTDADNIQEIKQATKIANQYPDTVKAIIIGNEVFLRQEQDEATMQRYLRLAHQLTNTPITYADVWEFWRKHPAIEQHVDFITVHILPYWENVPVNIANSTAHAKAVMANIQSIFSKPILIGETGWPSTGRQRDESSPSVINQARYIREFLTVAHQEGWQYNIIEAIDQPWKRTLEGTVGGYWGVYSTDLLPKFSLTAPVAERHDGFTPIIFALLGAIVMFGLTRDINSNSYRFAWVILGMTSGLVALLQLDYLTAACRDLIEWIALGGIAAIGWFGIACLPTCIHQTSVTSKRIIKWVLFSLMIASIVSSWLIYSDGRYRDFPNLLCLLPVLVIPASLLVNNISITHQKWMILPIIACVSLAILAVNLETNNTAAYVWGVLSIIISLAHWPNTKQSA